MQNEINSVHEVSLPKILNPNLIKSLQLHHRKYRSKLSGSDKNIRSATGEPQLSYKQHHIKQKDITAKYNVCSLIRSLIENKGKNTIKNS